MLFDLLILGLLLLILVVLVVAHEFGHFIVARRNGVDVEEFGIFFPPKLWSHKTKDGWLFTINAIPLGGFVKLKGEYDSSTKPHGYGVSSTWTKTKILTAGVAMNFLAAFIVLTILAWIGMPQLVNKQFTIKSDTHIVNNEVLVGYIEVDSPAQRAGLTINDRLLAILPSHGKEVTITNASTLPSVTRQFAGQTVGLEFSHDKNIKIEQVKFRDKSVVVASQKTNNPKGYLGIVAAQYNLQRSSWSAPIVAAGLIVQFTALTFQGLGSALHGVGSIGAAFATHNHAEREAGQAQANQLSGPVGIFKLLKSSTSFGFQYILMIAGLISLSLAVINILPVPPLDGGKLFMTLIARCFRKTLSERAEILANSLGFVFFLAVFVLLTIGDVHKHF
ncbi:MAG TPA: M50 family metallopeptidase [Candidatus Saccharimonadales bacterium]|nr:M50 family metallopeptidase [Candidatus Saccharimonadales bacterium]